MSEETTEQTNQTEDTTGPANPSRPSRIFYHQSAAGAVDLNRVLGVATIPSEAQWFGGQPKDSELRYATVAVSMYAHPNTLTREFPFITNREAESFARKLCKAWVEYVKYIDDDCPARWDR